MITRPAVPDPPYPFDPAVEVLAADVPFYRVHSVRRGAGDFNPGLGGASRFAFFGDRLESVLYAAASEQAAVAETLLHDVPVTGGLLRYDQYVGVVMSRLTTTRPLRLAVFYGLGLDRRRRLGVAADEVTASPAHTYADTVRWAEAAFRAGFDGVVWMSRMCNDAKAYVFFGSRCEGAFGQDPGFGRIFATGADQMWLIDLCAPLHVDVLVGK